LHAKIFASDERAITSLYEWSGSPVRRLMKGQEHIVQFGIGVRLLAAPMTFFPGKIV
jgi:hypothetical protein